MNGFGKKWWKAAGMRAIKTIAQTAIATIGTSAVMSDVNWLMVLSASVLSGILSLLTSVAGLPELEENDINGNLIVSSNANEELLSLEITPEQLKGIDTQNEMTFKIIHK